MFRRWMNGRYGIDQLTVAMLVLVIVVDLVLPLLIGMIATQVIAIILLFLCYYRVFSKNVFKRSQENARFLCYYDPIRFRFNRFMTHLKQRRQYRFFRCPNCKQRLRVPKGKGEITITCAKCRYRFDKRT